MNDDDALERRTMQRDKTGRGEARYKWSGVRIIHLKPFFAKAPLARQSITIQAITIRVSCFLCPVSSSGTAIFLSHHRVRVLQEFRRVLNRTAVVRRRFKRERICVIV